MTPRKAEYKYIYNCILGYIVLHAWKNIEGIKGIPKLKSYGNVNGASIICKKNGELALNLPYMLIYAPAS